MPTSMQSFPCWTTGPVQTNTPARTCHNLTDVTALLAGFNAHPEQHGEKVFILFADEDGETGRYDYRKRPVLSRDSEADQFKRTATNALLDLVGSSEFWRKTTVAAKLTDFWFADGGKFGGTASRCGLVKLRKKVGEEFTLIFTDAAAAARFVRAVAF